MAASSSKEWSFRHFGYTVTKPTTGSRRGPTGAPGSDRPTNALAGIAAGADQITGRVQSVPNWWPFWPYKNAYQLSRQQSPEWGEGRLERIRGGESSRNMENPAIDCGICYWQGLQWSQKIEKEPVAVHSRMGQIGGSPGWNKEKGGHGCVACG